ncbi:hypothetical protein BDZ45DRAFT_676244 [Acephala macrosclerotiorum]|nr:hypothetical protein BDZ45DRAFT_676244 [Acephala macrosclerotiorum]
MPPHLHPRSRLTSSLFATTLFASFFVVALPHALPCPAPRVAYADDGTPQNGGRRRRRKCVDEENVKEGVVEESGDEVEGDRVRKSKRECPVPKPPGIIGEILGFKSSNSSSTSRPESSSSEGKGSRPP